MWTDALPTTKCTVRIVRACDPAEAHARPLPASLPRAYRTASTSWRQQCARTEAGMLGEPGKVGSTDTLNPSGGRTCAALHAARHAR